MPPGLLYPSFSRCARSSHPSCIPAFSDWLPLLPYPWLQDDIDIYVLTYAVMLGASAVFASSFGYQVSLCATRILCGTLPVT